MVINPYARQPQGVASGAYKSAKKKGTKAKHQRIGSQRTIEGRVAFNCLKNCKVCVAQTKRLKGVAAAIPHRPHHKLCPRNRRTKGWMSDRSVFVEAEGNRNLAVNNAPIVPVPRLDIRPANNPGQLFLLFHAAPNSLPEESRQPSAEALKNTFESGISSTFQNVFQLANPTSIREAVETRLQTLAQVEDEVVQPGLKFLLEKQRYPKQIGAAVDYIYALLANNKPSCTSKPLPSGANFDLAYQKFQAFFCPGSAATFTFPRNVLGPSKAPNLAYHLLEGQSIVYLDWKLLFPAEPLCCPNCIRQGKVDCCLRHERTNWLKNRSLFPLWTSHGVPTWCIAMQYNCESCSSLFAANDGRLLNALPAHVRQAYPVNPPYAKGAFHLSEELTFDLELLMKTYANASFFSKKLYKQMYQQFTTKVATYLSQIWTKFATDKMPKLRDFTNNFFPPSNATIRELYKAAENSPETPYGYSYSERYRCKLQSVDVRPGKTITFDHTFQTVKNYPLPGAKAVFTGNKGTTKEVVSLAIVPSTATKDIAHLLVQSRQKRKVFAPSILYTDTCPNAMSFYKSVFGSTLEMKLGLFCLIQQVTDTLDPKSELYWEAMVALQECLYSYLSNPHARLIEALKDGTFDRLHKKYSPKEIEELRRTKKWKQRFGAYLPKSILPGSIVQTNLERWIVAFESLQDSEGRSVFTHSTTKVTRDQLNKVQYISDPHGMEMYLEMPASATSAHGLSKWLALRPESSLENFHELLAHIANTGSGRELADVLTMGGVAEFNVACRHKIKLLEARKKGLKDGIPTHFEGVPPFSDHSMLCKLNYQAVELGLPKPFENPTKCCPDNGEVFCQLTTCSSKVETSII